MGQGRNSTVFLVNDPQRGGEIVVKEIPKSAFRDPADFFREAQAMFAAQAPNVVPLYVASETDDAICVAMPYFKNGSLADRIAVNPLQTNAAIRIAQDMLNGLGRIHAKGFIHFDVKPTNILIDDQGNAMVADFGQTRPTGALGLAQAPPLYMLGMPPEVFNTMHGVVQSDIYQAGLTLYRAVNGDPLFKRQCPPDVEALQSQVLAEKFPSRELFQPHVPKALRTIIRKSLHVKTNDRFGSAADMADAIARVRVRHDWRMERQLSGEITWICRRANQPSLIVSVTGKDNAFDVQFFTEGDGARRAREKKKWAVGLAAKDTAKFLKEHFESME